MQKPALPFDEPERLQALYRCEILDTAPERRFDDIAELASFTCEAPIALVSLVDRDRQWFKAKVGLDIEETARDVSFCGHAILGDEILLVGDASNDQRFADNPLVTCSPGVRFYAGVPLIAEDDRHLGTLCVMDTVPRELTRQQCLTLERLARQVVSQLELRLRAVELEESRRRIESARNAERRFLASVSHELRTPLAAILGYAEELLRQDLDIVGRSFAKRIHENGRTLLALVEDVLTLSQLHSGSAQVSQELVPVRSLLHEVIVDSRDRAEARGLKLDFEIDDSVPEKVSLDRRHVRQILTHLVGNALKFTAQGSVSVAAWCDTGGQRLIITVEDTGIGIAAAHLEVIFERFRQLDGTLTRCYGGRGLGLSVARDLAELLGGRLTVESQLGEGSRFSLYLPIEKQTDDSRGNDNRRTACMDS